MKTKFYPNEREFEEYKSNNKKVLKISYHNSIKIFVLFAAMFTFFLGLFALSMFTDHVPLLGIILPASIAMIFFTFTLLSILSVKKDKENLMNFEKNKDNEIIILQDDKMEYHYTEKEKDYIISFQYKAIDNFDIYSHGVRINLFEGEFTIEGRKHGDETAHYLVDNSIKDDSIFVSNYFDSFDELIDIIQKQKEKVTNVH